MCSLRVFGLQCALHCVMTEGAGRGLWACEGLGGGDTWVRDEHMLLGDVRKKGGVLELVCMCKGFKRRMQFVFASLQSLSF